MSNESNKTAYTLLMSALLGIAVLVASVPPFAFAFPALKPLYWPLTYIGLSTFFIYLVVASIAFKKAGRSPFLALWGLLFGLIPIILYTSIKSDTKQA